MVLIVLWPVTVWANPLQDVRSTFMTQCASDGNELATCTCLFEGWSTRVPEDQHGVAATAIMMFAGVQPDNQDDMMAAASMVQSMTDLTFQCALGGSDGAAQISPEALGVVSGIMSGAFNGDPGSNSAGALGGALAGALSGVPQSAVPEPKAPEETGGDWNAQHKIELTRIDARPLESWALADLKPLFTSYCRSGGEAEAGCGCAWGVLAATGGSVDVAYLASRGEGDGVIGRMGRSRFNSALDGLNHYNEARGVCDG